MTIKRDVQYKGKTETWEFESEEDYQAFLATHNNDNQSREFFRRKGFAASVRYDGMVVPKGYENATPEQVKQRMRRNEALGQLVQDALVRIEPGASADIEYISFERFVELQKAYQQAVDAKETHAEALRRVGFQPTSIYAQKLYYKADGTARTPPIRQLIQNEVGIRPSGKILVLQDKMPGDEHSLVVGPHTFKKGT